MIEDRTEDENAQPECQVLPDCQAPHAANVRSDKWISMEVISLDVLKVLVSLNV